MSMSKLEINRYRDAGLTKEVFTHVTLGTFDVSEMRDSIAQATDAHRAMILRRCTYAELRMVDGEILDVLTYMKKHREVDMERCASLTEKELVDPLIYVLCPAEESGEPGVTHLLVDGIHRLIERQRRGKPDFYFYLIELRHAPRLNLAEYLSVPWGEKEVMPGVGLVESARNESWQIEGAESQEVLVRADATVAV